MSIKLTNSTGTDLNVLYGVNKPTPSVQKQQSIKSDESITFSAEKDSFGVYVLVWSTFLKKFYVTTLYNNTDHEVKLNNLQGYSRMQLKYGPINHMLE